LPSGQFKGAPTTSTDIVVIAAGHRSRPLDPAGGGSVKNGRLSSTNIYKRFEPAVMPPAMAADGRPHLVSSHDAKIGGQHARRQQC